MVTENLSTLKIHKLSKAQYDRELAAGRIDEQALYLTPDDGVDFTLEDKEKIDKIPSDIEEAGIITLTEYTEDDIQALWDSVIV